MNYQEIISEGVKDPHIFKAVFLFGGPGSGKSTVRRLLFDGTGLRPIDVDEVYEYLRFRQEIVGGWTDELYSYAGRKIQKKMDLYIDSRLGLVIDATGRDLGKTQQTKARLDNLGYETLAIYVKTDIDVALNRNEERRRMVKTEPGEYLPTAYLARKMHNEVKDNLPALRSMFGNDFITIKFSNDVELQSSIDANKSKIAQFLNKPPSGPSVQAWIQAQQKQQAQPVTENLDQTLESARNFVQQIMKKCKPYLDEINADLGNYPLYRGTRKKYQAGTKLTHSATPRDPVDTDLQTHNLFNQAIQNAGKTADRSNAIFTSGSLRVAKRYGDTNLVFPIGDFYYTWSTKVADWYWYMVPVQSQIGLENLEYSIRGDDNSLKQAIKSNHEIMLHCPNGYYVYPHTDLQYLEQYLNHFMRG